MIHVGESHWAYYGGHPFFPAPPACGVKQGVDNLFVVDEIEKSEAQASLSCAFVDGVVYDGCYAADRFAVAVGHE